MTNPNDPLELLRRFWAPLGVPVPDPSAPAKTVAPMMPGASFMPPMAFPTTDPQEIDKRIADLRSVESWLSLNLEMVRTTIQGLEAQKATLAAFFAMQNTMSETLKAQAESVARATEAGMNLASAAQGQAKPRRLRRKKAT